MKAFIAAALLLCWLIEARAYDERRYFFLNTSDIPEWSIIGNRVVDDGPTVPLCVAQQDYGNGSYVKLVKEAISGSTWLHVSNTKWSIGDYISQDKLYEVAIKFTVRGKPIRSFETFYKFKVVDKNTIVLPEINQAAFIPAFMKADKMTLVMPGDTPYVTIPLTKEPGLVISAMMACLYKWAGKKEDGLR